MARLEKAARFIVRRSIAYARAWRARTSLNGSEVTSSSQTWAPETPFGARNAVLFERTAGTSVGRTCQIMSRFPARKSVTIAVGSGERTNSIRCRQARPPKWCGFGTSASDRFGTNELTLYGPVPVPLFARVSTFWVSLILMSTSAFGRIALGLPSLIRTRYGLSTRTERMSFAFARCCDGTFGSSTRRMFARTSSPLKARPVEYLTPFRSVNHHVFRSAEERHFVARSGTTFMLRSYLERPL